MAKKTTTFHKPIPAGEKLRLLVLETLEAIARNFHTQGIFPYEVYSGYRKKNMEARKGQWRSTGAAFDSFYFQINDALQASDVSVREARIDFFFNYYLKFVDMGVGRGRPISKVKREIDADFNIRYMEWNSQEGSTQRPAIMMEFRHQARRMRNYWANRYLYEAQAVLVEGLAGITGDLKIDL